MSAERPGEQIKIYGPIGSPNFKAGLPPGSDGFRISERRIPVNTEGQQMSDAADQLYLKYKRPHPWVVMADHIWIMPHAKSLRKQITAADTVTPKDQSSFFVPGSVKAIRLESLERERLTKAEAFMIESSLVVEDFLPDFGESITGMYRGYNGLQRAGYQWIGEENEHGLVLKEILTRTKSRTQQEISALREEALQGKWVSPFETPRRVAIYADFQEKITHLVYNALANNINRPRTEKVIEEGVTREVKLEPARVSATILKELIGADELNHNRYYRDSVRLFAELDPKGTAEDVYFVASVFQMPADELLPQAARRFVQYKNGIGVNRVAFAAILYKSMLDMNSKPHDNKVINFVEETEARRIAAFYAGVPGVDGSDPEQFKLAILKPRKPSILTLEGLAA